MTEAELAKHIASTENSSELANYWQQRYEKFFKTKLFVVHDKTIESVLSKIQVSSPITPFGHLDLPKFVSKNRSVDEVNIQSTMETAIRFLDSVLDIINFTPDAKKIVMGYRKIGIGVANFEQYLELRGSTSEIDEIDYLGNMISSTAFRTSENLAEEKGICVNWDDISRTIRPKSFEYWYNENTGEMKNGLDINEDFTPQTIALSYFWIIPRRNSNILLYPNDIEWQIWADRDESIKSETPETFLNTPTSVIISSNDDEDNHNSNSKTQAKNGLGQEYKPNFSPLNSIIDQSKKKISQWFGGGEKPNSSEFESSVEQTFENNKQATSSFSSSTMVPTLDMIQRDIDQKINQADQDSKKENNKNKANSVDSKIDSQNKNDSSIQAFSSQISSTSSSKTFAVEETKPTTQIKDEEIIKEATKETTKVESKSVETKLETMDNIRQSIDQITVENTVNPQPKTPTIIESKPNSISDSIKQSILESAQTMDFGISNPTSNVIQEVKKDSSKELEPKVEVKPEIKIEPKIMEAKADSKTNVKEIIPSSKSVFNTRQIVKIVNPQSPFVGQLFQVDNIAFNKTQNTYQISLDSQDQIICGESDLISVNLKSIEQELANRPKVAIQAVVLSDDGTQVLVDQLTQNLPQTELLVGKNPEMEMTQFLVKKYQLTSDFVDVSIINFENDVLNIVYHIKLTQMDQVKSLEWIKLTDMTNSVAKATLNKILEKIRRWQASSNQKANQLLQDALLIETAKVETKYVLLMDKVKAEAKFTKEAETAKSISEYETRLKILKTEVDQSKQAKNTIEHSFSQLSSDYQSTTNLKKQLQLDLDQANSQIQSLNQELQSFQSISEEKQGELTANYIANQTQVEQLQQTIQKLEDKANEQFSITRSNLFAPTLIPKPFQASSQNQSKEQIQSSQPQNNLNQDLNSPFNPQQLNEHIAKTDDSTLSILLKMKKVGGRN